MTPPPNVAKIIEIVREQSDNHAACSSRVSHAIFDDFNLGSGKHLYNCATDHAGWKNYIDDQYADMLREKRADTDFHLMLHNVTEAINALLGLCLFDDEDLEAAAEYLWEHGLNS